MNIFQINIGNIRQLLAAILLYIMQKMNLICSKIPVGIESHLKFNHASLTSDSFLNPRHNQYLAKQPCSQ